MPSHKDVRDHLYLEVENIRVTYIPAKDRDPDADWSGTDVIRVQSYKSPENKALHMGAELPVASPEVFGRFVAAICQVYIEGRT